MVEALARTTDPQTSHAAAASVTGQTDVQRNILYILKTYGAMHDVRLAQHYRSAHLLPFASESSLRTRRKELVDQGLINATEHDFVLPSGRKSIIWEAA